MSLNAGASAAVVFLVLYAVLFVVLIFGYATRRLKLRSRYTTILFHVAIRLASQGTGLAFAIKGIEATDLLIAYLILGAEGYFTLVLCTIRFLISWHNHNLDAHDSWLEARRKKGQSWRQSLAESFSLRGLGRSPMVPVHYALVVANAIIIAGGSILAGNVGVAIDPSKIATAKALRCAGQAVFLAITCVLLGCIVATIRQNRRERGKVHPTLLILLGIWPWLAVRGLYGVLASYLDKFSYYYEGNYDEHGLTNGFVASEYVLGTMTEWVSCLLLMATCFTSLHDPPKGEVEDVQNQDVEDKDEV